MSALYFHEIQPHHIGWTAEFTIHRSTVMDNETPSRFVVTGKLDGFIKDDAVDATKVALLVAGQKFVIDLAPHPEQFLINLTNPNGFELC